MRGTIHLPLPTSPKFTSNKTLVASTAAHIRLTVHFCLLLFFVNHHFSLSTAASHLSDPCKPFVLSRVSRPSLSHRHKHRCTIDESFVQSLLHRSQTTTSVTANCLGRRSCYPFSTSFCRRLRPVIHRQLVCLVQFDRRSKSCRPPNSSSRLATSELFFASCHLPVVH